MCEWCGINEGKVFWVTGMFICGSCKKDAEDTNKKIIEDTINELKGNKDRLDKWW